MKSGDIVLTKIPQDEQQKRRPVLILKILPKYNDLLVCAISSQLHQFIQGFDILIHEKDSGFPASGLQRSSVFRLSSLAVLSNNDIEATIGFLQQNHLNTLLKNLSEYLLK